MHSEVTPYASNCHTHQFRHSKLLSSLLSLTIFSVPQKLTSLSCLSFPLPNLITDYHRNKPASNSNHHTKSPVTSSTSSNNFSRKDICYKNFSHKTRTGLSSQNNKLSPVQTSVYMTLEMESFASTIKLFLLVTALLQ